ncbi:hypothetical protein [Bifidobacterium longum]|uniref:hypothetical protein n=1 Tax=Bifidobacterium longum TaxID=216816 RepID=UPI001A966AB5|nr:hypothetical protein [Bifidobacterium longum]QSY59642.1 hypothetical protein BLL421_09070 [Bifidobacterium longum subsp. longum]UHC30179.1 hypothetical protein LT344_04860 [Bifidobacterium longum]
MSYDLFIVDKDLPEPEWFDVCELDGEHGRTVAHGRSFNYTYNLSAFFTDYKVNPIHDLDGLTAGEAAARIDKALKDIYLEPLYVLRGKYNPLNSWGSVDGAIKWLERVQDYCREHPDYIVRERS